MEEERARRSEEMMRNLLHDDVRKVNGSPRD